MTSRTIEQIEITRLVLSRFNTRRTRPQADVDKLADRIKRLGFEATRAPWGYLGPGDSVEVFAGGTRLEAARQAGLATLPVLIFDGYSDDDFARLADEDNEADEYHAKVPVVDIWAEFHRLAKDEGWTQARIAAAKGCDRAQVARRVGWHERLPEVARRAVCDGLFDEGHCQALSELVCDVTQLEGWLTTEHAQAELVAEVLGKHRGSTAGIKPTVAVVRDAAKRWKAMIAEAAVGLDKFPATPSAYGPAGALVTVDWRAAYVDALISTNARTLAAVNAAIASISKRKTDADAKEAARKLAVANEETKAAEKERKENEHRQKVAELTARVVLGDARQTLAAAPDGISLLLTDPPYGMDFQSGRRTTTAKKSAIANDGHGAALALLADVLILAIPKMAADSTLLCFVGWRQEPDFRRVIEAAGFAIKGSLVWVKHNHGTGDLAGSFAPKHERIIHAVKGKPALRQRPDDVLHGKDKQNSEHPTEKPADLLATLIKATTDEGQLVADPFAGSGSTLLVAHALGRNFWGCEVDKDWHGSITDRLVAMLTEGDSNGV